jgi:carbon storage regulator
MLVLTRKYQEKIHIGDNITITVLRTKGKAVRLGIEAPADVPVIRGELAFHEESIPASVSSDAFDGDGASKRRATAGETKPASLWAVNRENQTKVSLSRVPRNKLADVLPKLVPGTAPLRAIMEQGAAR